MIRFSNQLWQNAVVAVAVVFAATNVEAVDFGGIARGAKNVGGSVSNTVKQPTNQVHRQANQATRQVQNLGQAATRKTQQASKSTQNAVKSAGQGVQGAQSQTLRSLGSIREQANSAAKRASQQPQSAASRATNVVKHAPTTVPRVPTTVPHKTIGQLPKSLSLPKPSVKSVPNIPSAINSTKQTLGRSAQVVKQDLSKNINLRVPRMPAPAVPKLPQRNPLASVPVIKGRPLPNKTIPKIGLPELPGAPLPTFNPKVDATKAVAAATLVVGTLNQVLNGGQAEAAVGQPTQPEILITENGTGPVYVPTSDVPPTTQPTDSIPTPPYDAPVDPATAGLQLAGSIVDLVAAGVANQSSNHAGADIQDFSGSAVATPSSESMDMPITAPVEEPTEFTFVIHNMTEQPLTYSIRAAGTQWGTYTLAAGKNHQFKVKNEEMEVRYTNGEGEQTVTVPGEHVYAFAELEGRVELCNADPEEETAAE